MSTLTDTLRGKAADWTSEDPVLLVSEIGCETDTGKWKSGDGTNKWSDLSYGPGLLRIGREVFGGLAALVETVTKGESALNVVPAGGTTGQILAKKSNTDYDTEWIDPAASSGADARMVGGL